MRYFIGLGGNLGDRAALLRRAVDALAHLGTLSRRSRIFSSSPIGGPPQPAYLNAAVLLDAELAPMGLLAATQRIERELGRDRATEVRWGPRLMDLDVLLAGERGELVLALPDLTVPHPRLHERPFALLPLLDLDETLIHPIARRPMRALLHEHIDFACIPIEDRL